MDEYLELGNSGRKAVKKLLSSLYIAGKKLKKSQEPEAPASIYGDRRVYLVKEHGPADMEIAQSRPIDEKERAMKIGKLEQKIKSRAKLFRLKALLEAKRTAYMLLIEAREKKRRLKTSKDKSLLQKLEEELESIDCFIFAETEKLEQNKEALAHPKMSKSKKHNTHAIGTKSVKSVKNIAAKTHIRNHTALKKKQTVNRRKATLKRHKNRK